MTPPHTPPQTLQRTDSAPIYHESWNCQTEDQSDSGHSSQNEMNPGEGRFESNNFTGSDPSTDS